MQIDISEIVSCENREVTEKVHSEQDTFVSRLGEFPITESAPFDLRIANREGSELLLSGETDLTVSIPCSRCLTEVPTDIHIVIDKKLRMDGTEVVAHGRSAPYRSFSSPRSHNPRDILLRS